MPKWGLLFITQTGAPFHYLGGGFRHVGGGGHSTCANTHFGCVLLNWPMRVSVIHISIVGMLSLLGLMNRQRGGGGGRRSLPIEVHVDHHPGQPISIDAHWRPFFMAITNIAHTQGCKCYAIFFFLVTCFKPPLPLSSADAASQRHRGWFSKMQPRSGMVGSINHKCHSPSLWQQ